MKKIYKISGINPETKQKEKCIFFILNDEYFVTFEKELQTLNLQEVVKIIDNNIIYDEKTDKYTIKHKIYELWCQNVTLFFGLDKNIYNKIKFLSDKAWNETETQEDYNFELENIIYTLDSYNYYAWLYLFKNSDAFLEG